MKSGGEQASDLRASAAIALSRIAGPETYDAFKSLVDKETAAAGVFGMALDRMQVAKDCGEDINCYGKTLKDPSWTRAEKAAFAIAFSGNAKQGLPLLLGALQPITAMAQDRYPVHQAILFGLHAPRLARLQRMHRQADHPGRQGREGRPPAGRARPAGRDPRRRSNHREPGRQRPGRREHGGRGCRRDARAGGEG